MKKRCNKFFIDFKKAFDTVDHEILLYKLECYGKRGLFNDFFRSYLTNIRQHAVINGVNSELRTVSCGVPQGSVLEPLFFLLYINDLYKSIGHESVRLYADDTAIITSNSNLDIAQQQARDMFTKVSQIIYRSIMIKPTLYCSIWKTNRFLNIFIVSKQMLCKSIESILYSIWECYLMNIYIGTSTSIRFANSLWNTLGFLIT